MFLFSFLFTIHILCIYLSAYSTFFGACASSEHVLNCLELFFAFVDEILDGGGDNLCSQK